LDVKNLIYTNNTTNTPTAAMILKILLLFKTETILDLFFY
jgi:hypothetical protein